MGTFINKTNTDHLLRKLVKGNFANNMYGIYSNQCFDNLDNQSIAIVKPVDFILLVQQYVQMAQQQKMNWKTFVDAFYKNELLPFARIKRNTLGLKFLYHGSDNKFDPNAIRVSNPYDNSMKNGHADGYGTDINTALRYGAYLYIYVWNPNKVQVRKLSQTRNTLPREFYNELLVELNNEDEYFYNYGDIEYEGFDTVMGYAMQDLEDNDVDNINSIINAGGNADTVVKYLTKYGYGYTVNKRFNDQIIIYNKNLITPYTSFFSSQLGNPIQRA